MGKKKKRPGVNKSSSNARSSNQPGRVAKRKRNRRSKRGRQKNNHNQRMKRAPKETLAIDSNIPKEESKAPYLELDEEQRTLVDLILTGRNVFYTGAAGCGKSTVLKECVRRLQESGKHVDITAPTGRAALEINGCTFWTYAGWTPLLMKEPLETLKHNVHMRRTKERLLYTDVLIIDEISMVENHHFERLNAIMQEARHSDEAFGGVQLIVTGDFCQLPPVKPFAYCLKCGQEMIRLLAGSIYKCPKHGEFFDEDKWAFQSSVWKKCNFAYVYLKKIHRQQDRNFIEILEKIRLGKTLSEQDKDMLLNHKTNFKSAVKLFPTREEVRRINQAEFDQLPTEKRIFRCRDVFEPSTECDHHTIKKYNTRAPDGSLHELRDHRFESITEIKVGMQVILLVNLNINRGLVNGSQGKVVGWKTFDQMSDPYNMSRQDCDAAQNITAPSLEDDYMLHRQRNIATFMQEAARTEWPVVLFNNGLERTIIPDCIVNAIGNQKPWSLLSRTQVPLLPAWALSIHKSQGMTLNSVIVDLSKCFEEGQVYVALSRASSLAGLKVYNLGTWLQRGNEQVMRFLEEKFGIK